MLEFPQTNQYSEREIRYNILQIVSGTARSANDLKPFNEYFVCVSLLLSISIYLFVLSLRI